MDQRIRRLESKAERGLKKCKWKLIICLFYFFFFLSFSLAFSSGLRIEPKNNGTFDVVIDGLPVSQAIRELSTLVPFELKGTVGSTDIISVSYKNISLNELLKKILRGYNYVLITSEGKKPVLVIFGKAERSKYVEPPPIPKRETETPAQLGVQRPASPQEIPPAVQRRRDITYGQKEAKEAQEAGTQRDETSTPTPPLSVIPFSQPSQISPEAPIPSFPSRRGRVQGSEPPPVPPQRTIDTQQSSQQGGPNSP